MRKIKRTAANEIIDCGDYCEVILYNVQGEENARTKIDHEDRGAISKYRWFRMNNRVKPYASGNVNGERTLLHRFLMQTDDHVDHINGDAMDNRRANLRTATQSQNMMNRKAERGELVGVRKNKHRKKWEAHIKCDGQKYYLGSFVTLAEAMAARQAGEKILFGEYSWRYSNGNN